jgi:hypothetical protein
MGLAIVPSPSPKIRTWARYKALEWVFKGNNCLFLTIISALQHITVDDSFDNITSSEANSLIKKFS